MVNVEICCGSLESALAAQQGGAYRIELCSSLIEGGVTPSYGLIKAAREMLSIKISVMIRPRGGDFVYTESDLEMMKSDILAAKSLGADGVVFGCLTPDGEVDQKAMKYLISASESMEVTFHRAFDITRDPLRAIEEIISLGCDRILTSGAKSTAYDGIELLRKLNILSNNRIIIMPGCGVNVINVREIVDYTGVSEIHLSASVGYKSKSVFVNPDVDFGPNPKVSSVELINSVIFTIKA